MKRDGRAAHAWPSTEQIMQRRREAGWVSPLKPLERGDSICLFASRGTFEFLVHPADGERYLKEGFVVDGQRLRAVSVDEFPLMNGMLLRTVDAAANTGFIEAADSGGIRSAA